MDNKIGVVKRRLSSARSVVVLTGAGVSAESGVPTFRGAEGLWRNFRPEELATPQAFQRDPKQVWEWYDWRRGLIAKLSPNPGHFAIAKMEKEIPDFLLVTQNVDGLHRLAGNAKMVELHGNIWHTRCVAEGMVEENRDVPLREIPPKCRCGALLRPHIVWFGESLEEENLGAAFDACKKCELMIVAGTSSVVQPAASLAGLAKDSGALVVEINPDETAITEFVDISIRGKSGEVLPLLAGGV
jgi:NAD-dependent deacetylase